MSRRWRSRGGMTPSSRLAASYRRHISMLALAGAIGTGLFLSLGTSIQTAGPLGALLGYGTIGLIVCCVQFALGETTALMPVTGSFVRHCEFLADPALGFAVGWNLTYGNVISIPTEIVAICVLFQYWTDLNSAIFIVIFLVLTFVVGIAFIRVFGEVEFAFAMVKIALVVFLIIFGLVINLGGIPGVDRIGFRYWNDPGPFVAYIGKGSWGNFLGYWQIMTSAAFSFSGIESLAMAAAETRNPRKAIPIACKRVFFRIVLFYLLSVLVVGMLVPSNDPRLNDDSGTASQSPFVIAASAAGYPAVGSVVNAIVITSAWSSSNQAMLTSTRALYALALKGQAPKAFLRTTRWGAPWVGVLFCTAFILLSFMTLSNGAMTVFYWLVDLTAVGTMISWLAILTSHIRLKMAMRKQGYSWHRLPWHNVWTYYGSWISACFLTLILFTNGFTAFTKGNWSASTFVSAYIDIPLVLLAFGLWKLIKKTRWIPLSAIPLAAALDEADRDIEEEKAVAEAEPPKKDNWRFISWLWS